MAKLPKTKISDKVNFSAIGAFAASMGAAYLSTIPEQNPLEGTIYAPVLASAAIAGATWLTGYFKTETAFDRKVRPYEDTL